MNADAESVDSTIQELMPLADAAELAGALAHEVNDFLNVLHLQLAVLELKAPPEARADLREVQRQAQQLAQLVKHWQRSRSRSTPSRPTDLGSLLNRLCFEPGSVTLQIDVASSVQPIQGVASDVRRLIEFLVKNAISAAGGASGRVAVRVESGDRSVRLRVEDSGPALPEESLVRAFDPGFAGRPGTDRLELAACLGIVRRMNGTIRAENLPGGSFAVVVELPAAS